MSGVEIALTETTVPPDQPLMKLEQPPQWTSPLGGGGKREEGDHWITSCGLLVICGLLLVRLRIQVDKMQ